jgi:hypothetical protein
MAELAMNHPPLILVLGPDLRLTSAIRITDIGHTLSRIGNVMRPDQNKT